MIRNNKLQLELDPAFNEIKRNSEFEEEQTRLYECHGRIIGDYPIFLLRKTLLAEKMIERAHYQTLQGGVNVTMTDIQRKVLDTKAEITNKRDHTDMPWMPEIPHNCICNPNIRPTNARQNK